MTDRPRTMLQFLDKYEVQVVPEECGYITGGRKFMYASTRPSIGKVVRIMSPYMPGKQPGSLESLLAKTIEEELCVGATISFFLDLFPDISFEGFYQTMCHGPKSEIERDLYHALNGTVETISMILRVALNNNGTAMPKNKRLEVYKQRFVAKKA